ILPSSTRPICLTGADAEQGEYLDRLQCRRPERNDNEIEQKDDGYIFKSYSVQEASELGVERGTRALHRKESQHLQIGDSSALGSKRYTSFPANPSTPHCRACSIDAAF